MKKIFISIFITVFLLLIFYIINNQLLTQKEILMSQDNKDIEDLSDDVFIETEDSDENIVLENEIIEENSIAKVEEIMIQENNQNQIDNNIQVPIKCTSNKTVNEKQEFISENKIDETQTSPVETLIQIQNIENVQKPEINTVTEEKIEVSIQPTQELIPETKEIGEKYVRNDEMINKMKEVINNNTSEYMNNYGYTIEVDESIKSHTNPFTFTENRVNAYITYCFGKIRIYAEDYYKDGQLIMTDCYIF